MRRSGTMLMTLTIAALSSLMAQPASATTLEVGSCVTNNDAESVSAHFSTIQAAVNAAPPGSTVLVCPGSYAEQVEITKPLTLKGVASGNMGAAIVVPPPNGLIVPPGGITVTAPQIWAHDTPGPVNISDLTVDGSNNQITSCVSPVFVEGVYFLDASGSIDHVVARNQRVSVAGTDCVNGIGIRVTSDLGSALVTVTNNAVSAYDFTGIFASYQMANVTIRNNSVVGQPGTAGIILFFDVQATVSENSVVGNSNANLGGSGIDVVGVHHSVVSANHFGSNGYGIALYTFTGDPNSDDNTISNNKVFGSDGDGIAVCGDNNLVKDNTISGSTESGVNLVTGPTFGANCTANNNQVADNIINGACAGVLMDPGAVGNTVDDENRFLNTVNLRLTGISCPLPPAASMAQAAKSVPRARLVVRPGN